MAGRAFKVPVPKSYANVTEAKLVQRGTDVWVQLPANLVQDRRMSRKSVYMQDYNRNGRTIPQRFRNVKPKVVTRRGSYPHMDTGGLDFDVSCNGTRNLSRSLSNSFGGMTTGTHYGKRSKRNEPITAFLPVMSNANSPELRMDHHYSSPMMSLERSYNDKARDALPGCGKWSENGDLKDVIVTRHSGTISGDDFLENPLRKPDLLDYEQKRSVTIRSPRMHSSHSSRSALGWRLDEGHALLDSSDHPVNLDAPTLDNSAKRHELEILTKVNPTSSVTALDHLYQPSNYNTGSGYTVVGGAYEHGNATFSHTGSPGNGSFTISPDWVSERKKSMVIRH